MKNTLTANILKKAFSLAKKIRTRAYAPYSQFHVGAVVITKSNKFFAGHNIENASYGGTVCAERVAIWNWASSNRRDPIQEILLVTNPLATPCGLCLQVMAEFINSKTLIHFSTPNGIKKTVTFDQLMPQRFDPKTLKSSQKN